MQLLHQPNNLRMHCNTCNYFLTINCYLATGSFSREGVGEGGRGEDGYRKRDLYSIPTASSLDWMQQCIDNTEPKWKVEPELNAHAEQRGEKEEAGEDGSGGVEAEKEKDSRLQLQVDHVLKEQQRRR